MVPCRVIFPLSDTYLAVWLVVMVSVCNSLVQKAWAGHLKPSQINLEDSIELVDSFYTIALTPERLDEIVSIWMQKIDAGLTSLSTKELPEASVNFLNAENLRAHMTRAEMLLRLLVNEEFAGHTLADEWVHSKHQPAIVFDRTGAVQSINMSANLFFGLQTGAKLHDLPIEKADLEVLNACVCHHSTSEPQPKLIRLQLKNSQSAVIGLLTNQVGSAENLVGFVANVVPWPNQLAQVLETTFALTGAEVEVLKHLTLGKNTKEIADETQRSAQTVKTHVRSLLAKTETKSQGELVRMSLSLCSVVLTYTQYENSPVDSSNQANQYKSVTLKDGRRLDYLDLCAPNGAPFLLLHRNICLCRLTAQSECMLASAGLRMIVPIRAGFGYSSPLPRGADAAETGASDIVELIDQLGLTCVPVVCNGGDLHLATLLAQQAPARITKIIGASALMPPFEPQHFARLDKFSRFCTANAKYAPRSMGFISMIFFVFARRQGVKSFLELVLNGDKADRLSLAQDDIINALERGAHAMMRPDFTAHVAWADDLISFTKDWRDRLIHCPVPITLLVGDQSPWVPLATVKDFAARSNNIEVVEYANTGQLLAYQHPSAIADQLLLARQAGTYKVGQRS